MKLKDIRFVIGISLALTAAVHAANTTLYVDASAPAPTYSLLALGDGGPQTGTLLDPFGSIQAAYHELWDKAGDHTILLADGTYTGAHIGYDNNSAYTDMIFMDAAKLSGNPAWSSVTLAAQNGPGNVTIDRNFPTQDMGNKDPTRFESLVALVDRSALFRLPLGSPTMVGMAIEDITIELAGGTSIVGSQGTGLQEWTFNNVDIFMESDQVANPLYLAGGGGGVPGRSALFYHNDTTDAMAGSFMSFNDSRIYVDPNTDEAFKTDGMFLGYRWFNNSGFPDGFFDGNGTSELLLWTTGAAVTGLEPAYTGDIWSSIRNQTGTGSTILYHTLDSGGIGADGLLTGFLTDTGEPIPEPASLALLMLAGSAMMLRRRRA